MRRSSPRRCRGGFFPSRTDSISLFLARLDPGAILVLALHLTLLLLPLHVVKAAGPPGPLGSTVVVTREAPQWAEYAPDDSWEKKKCTFDGGTLVISNPTVLGTSAGRFRDANFLRLGHEMVVDFVNRSPRCGLLVRGKRYSLTLRSFEVDSSPEKALAVSRAAVERGTDFFVGPHGNALTGPVAEVANETNKILVTTTSGWPRIHRGRPTVFGLFSKDAFAFRNVLAMLAKAGARTVYTVAEPMLATGCAEVPNMGKAHRMEMVGASQVPPSATAQSLDQIARNLSRAELNADVVVSCTRFNAGTEFILALRRAGWSPRALVQTGQLAINNPRLGSDAEYVLGAEIWDRLSPHRDGLTHWTGAEFMERFESYSGAEVTSTAAALGASAVSLLVQAIERADSIRADDIRQVMATGTFSTFLSAEVSFDEDGQSTVLRKPVQYGRFGPNLVYERENQNESAASPDLVYPMPIWAHRDCVNLSPCGERETNETVPLYNGKCLPDGTCQCEVEPTADKAWPKVSVGIGPTAACYEVPKEDMTYISGYLRIVGITFVAIQGFCSVLFVLWTINYRKRGVLRATQPVFLIFIVLGCFILSLSILPTIVQGEYRHEQDPHTGQETDVPSENIGRIDAACMAFPWFFCLGFIIIFSALFAKIWRVRKIMRHASQMRRTTVEAKDVAIVMVVFTSIEALLLLIWQLVDPLRWEREVLRANERGYPLESVGFCTSDNPLAFLIPIAIFNFGCLLYALFLCYVTRSVPSKLNEGKWITASIVSILQILLLAVPVLIIAWDDTDAFFFVRACVVFLMSMGVTCFTFLPKVMLLHFKNFAQADGGADFAKFSGRPSAFPAPKSNVVNECNSLHWHAEIEKPVSHVWASGISNSNWSRGIGNSIWSSGIGETTTRESGIVDSIRESDIDRDAALDGKEKTVQLRVEESKKEEEAVSDNAYKISSDQLG